MNELLGIFIGLAAALLQSCSYVVSGAYARESGRPAWTLLAPSFLLMGLAALAGLPFAWPAGRPDWGVMLPAAAGSILLCMAGNGATFLMLRHVDASRTSPLLALKVPMLAAAGALAGRPCTPVQWCGVALVVFAAALLSGAGRSIPAAAWAWLLAACATFCASDACIVLSYEGAREACGGSTAWYTLFSLCVIYVVGGIASAVVLPLQGVPPRATWVRYALPHAACWLTAMALLFACFALCGLVLGNVVQSTRGLLSVGIGWALARAGFTRLEERVSARTTVRRVIAAVLLVAAIALYAAGGPPRAG